MDHHVGSRHGLLHGPLDGVRQQLGWDPQPMEGNLTRLRRPVREQEPEAAGPVTA